MSGPNMDGLSVCLAQAVLDGDSEINSSAGMLLDLFLQQADPKTALEYWFGPALLADRSPDRERLRGLLTLAIAHLDELLNSQVNAILHNAHYQQIEASWRGLRMLTDNTPEGTNVKVRVLDVTWKELEADAERAIEFDQTQFFQKVYEAEFGKPGGQPYGLLLGDFAVSHRISAERPVNDVRLMRSLAVTASAAFAPLILSADSSLFGADTFDRLDRRLNLDRMFAQLEYTDWRSLTESEDSRYLGLLLPRVLMRAPYLRCALRTDQFPFEESVSGRDTSRYLWGSAVYALGCIAIRAFANHGWMEDIVGASRDLSRMGGRVDCLPVQSFATDAPGTCQKFSSELLVTDEMEREFSSHGFIPLCHCKYTDYAAFQNAPSIHRRAAYDSDAATRNEELSSQLNLMLCVARFAHYVKVIARDHTGSFHTPQMLESHLHEWILKYTSADDNIAPHARLSYPLRQAVIRVKESEAEPGTYICVAQLRPHVQADRAAASVRLVTELGRSSMSAGVAVTAN